MNGPISTCRILEKGRCALPLLEKRLVLPAEVSRQEFARLYFARMIEKQRQLGWRCGVVPLLESDPDHQWYHRPYLSRSLTGQRMQLRTAARRLIRVADLLACLHRQGICHGNLKLSNVIEDDGGELFLADPGPDIGQIASQLVPVDDPNATLRSHLPAALLHSASWEQVCGEPVTPASDVY